MGIPLMACGGKWGTCRLPGEAGFATHCGRESWARPGLALTVPVTVFRYTVGGCKEHGSAGQR